MKNIFSVSAIVILLLPTLSSCETEAERARRIQREARIEQERLERLRKIAYEDSVEAVRVEQERLRRAEKERIRQEQLAAERERERIKREKEAAERARYINNYLTTGRKPWKNCFGSSNSCSGYSCSEIQVKASYNSDVIVTIKRNGKVFRHGYIRRGDTYTFKLPDGTYQPFFYYGRGWNPNKEMPSATCSSLKGGFIEGENFDKDYPQELRGQILSYELILQENGNFSTKPSSAREAL